eukprot:78975_1
MLQPKNIMLDQMKHDSLSTNCISLQHARDLQTFNQFLDTYNRFHHFQEHALYTTLSNKSLDKGVNKHVSKYISDYYSGHNKVPSDGADEIDIPQKKHIHALIKRIQIEIPQKN